MIIYQIFLSLDFNFVQANFMMIFLLLFYQVIVNRGFLRIEACLALGSRLLNDFQFLFLCKRITCVTLILWLELIRLTLHCFTKLVQLPLILGDLPFWYAHLHFIIWLIAT